MTYFDIKRIVYEQLVKDNPIFKQDLGAYKLTGLLSSYPHNYIHDCKFIKEGKFNVIHRTTELSTHHGENVVAFAFEFEKLSIFCDPYLQYFFTKDMDISMTYNEYQHYWEMLII